MKGKYSNGKIIYTSPIYNFLVLVVYSSSPNAGTSTPDKAARCASVPRLICNAIYIPLILKIIQDPNRMMMAQ